MGGKSLLGSQWSAPQAALYRRICLMLNKNIREFRETGKVDNSSNIRQFHKVGYKDAKTWMERRLAAMKSGIPNWAPLRWQENGKAASPWTLPISMKA
jgi:hypothetical protein